MLKFFRKYVMNKWTLAIGGAVLMVVFLLPAGLGQGRGGGEDLVVGRLAGRKVRYADLRVAEIQLRVIESISPLLTRRIIEDHEGPRPEQYTALQWLLMLHEARAMGLSASEAEVDEFFSAFEVGHNVVQLLASRVAGTESAVRQAARSRIILHRYLALIDGLADVPIQEWAAQTRAAAKSWNEGNPMLGVALAQMSGGKIRVSDSLVRHFLHEALATVKILCVPVTPGRYLDQVPEPDERTMLETFERFKDTLPGQGQPHGFGYKYPDRVKIEYLSIDPASARAKVRVEEDEALSYYDANPGQFRGQGQDAPVKPYVEVRQQIIEQLRTEKSRRLLDDMVKEAQALLADDARRLEVIDGYRELPEGWQPVALEQVAQRISEKFGVLPAVRRIGDRWLDLASLANLPDIGNAFLVSPRQVVPFAQYVASVRELEPADNNPLATLRLQVGLPGETVRDFTGRPFVFRVLEAQKAHPPASIQEVFTQVRFDLRRLEGYKLLLTEKDKWLSRFKVEPAQDLAQELGSEVLQPAPFPRRLRTPTGLEPPNIPGIGASAELVDHVFSLAQKLADIGSASAATQADRSDAIALEQKLTLYLIRLEEFKPISEADYRMYASLDMIPLWIRQAIPADDDPLSLEALKRRTGYHDEGAGGEG